MSKVFEGHEPHMALQPSGKQFAAHANETAAPGNGALPPGANTFRVNKRKGRATTSSDVKMTGD